MKTFKSINLILMTLSVTETPVFSGTLSSLEEAAKKGLVKLIIKSKGGYTGDVMEMKIQNMSNQNLNLELEAGRRLDSKNNKEQDILVTKPQEVFLAAKQLKKINIFGMCCQAHNGAPKENSDYSIGHLADSNLIKLAEFIDKNQYYTNYSAQQAVWTISDNNSLASISSGNPDQVTNLQKYVSKITGRAIPAYQISYQQDNESDVLGRSYKIEGIFNYTVPENGKVTVGIYNEHGDLVQLIFKDIYHEHGDCKIFYKFRTHDLPRGTYYAKMNMNGAVRKEMEIEF
jgi:hypothetical protein